MHTAYVKVCTNLRLHQQPTVLTRAITDQMLETDLAPTDDLSPDLTDAAACKIVGLANQGEFDPDRLAAQVLMELGIDDYRAA